MAAYEHLQVYSWTFDSQREAEYSADLTMLSLRGVGDESQNGVAPYFFKQIKISPLMSFKGLKTKKLTLTIVVSALLHF